MDITLENIAVAFNFPVEKLKQLKEAGVPLEQLLPKTNQVSDRATVQHTVYLRLLWERVIDGKKTVGDFEGDKLNVIPFSQAERDIQKAINSITPNRSDFEIFVEKRDVILARLRDTIKSEGHVSIEVLREMCKETPYITLREIVRLLD